VIANTASGIISNAFGTATGANSVSYLTVTVTNLSAADFANVENILDEGTASSTSATAGSIRYSAGSSSLTFLAIPIQ
jgi:hypothetical protein